MNKADFGANHMLIYRVTVTSSDVLMTQAPNVLVVKHETKVLFKIKLKMPHKS